MKFVLLVHSPRSRWDEVHAAGRDDELERHGALIEELESCRWLLDCSPLAPPEQAINVRVRDGATLTAGHPAADTDDCLAGYYVIECPTTNEAVEVAARIPDADT